MEIYTELVRKSHFLPCLAINILQFTIMREENVSSRYASVCAVCTVCALGINNPHAVMGGDTIV